MSFAFPWSATRAARVQSSLVVLLLIAAVVGLSVVSAATLTPVQNVSRDGSESILPRVAQGPNGDLHVVWDSKEDERVVRYVKGIWNGASYDFQGSQIVAKVGSFQYATPAVAVAPNGRVMVAWSDGTLRARVWRGSESGPSGAVAGFSGGIQPSIFPDASSNFHMAWNGDFRLQYCQFNGTDCVSRTAFNDTENAANRPDVAVDSAGNVHMVWDTGQRTHYRVRAVGSANFGPISDIGGGNFPAIAADGKGNVHIVRSGDYNILYCRKTVSTPCGNQHTIDAADDVQPSVGATRGGSVVVTFRDTGNAVWFDSFENGQWQTTRTAGRGLQIDVSARPYTGRVSAVWSNDFDIQHLLMLPVKNSEDCEPVQSPASMPVAVNSATTRTFLPLIMKLPQPEPTC